LESCRVTSQLRLSWLLGLTAIALSSPVSAQTAPTPAASPPPVSTRAADLLIPARAGVGYSTSGGGYDGFGSFQGFIPIEQKPGKDLVYLVAQLLIDNEANFGGNLLVGYRTYNPGANRIYGGYLAYDNRDTGDNVFSQIGLGLETLGTGWDARLNAYVPVGSTRRTVSETNAITGFQPSSFRFQQNFLLASGTAQQTSIRDVDAAMAGFDLEAGGSLLRFGNTGDVRGYAGLYYISAGDSTLGVRGRLEVRPIENVTAGLAVQHDGIFGTNVVATIALSFPNTRPKGAEPRSVLARMGEFPGRQSAIVVDRQRETEQTTATLTNVVVQNPATRQPYVFQHVAVGTGGGNGTFESPFGVVQSALDATRSDGNSIVYVQAGTNPGIPAFTIPDRVQVLSTFPVQTLPAAIQGQRIADVTLPLSGLGAVRPTVTGTVTMRSDTVLSGFDITSATGAGITFNNVNRVEIRDNIVRNTASAGILGNGVAIANLFRNQIIAAQDQGVYLQNVGTATVTDNSVSNTRAGSGVISNPISGDISIGSITIPNPGSIIALPSGQGIVIATTTGDVNLARNTVSGTGTQGIVVLNARGNVAITDSSVSNTVGALFPVTIPGFGNFQVATGQGIVVSGVSGNMEVSRNTVNAVNGQGIAIAGTTNGTTTIANNTVRNTADQGLVVAGTSGTTNISNNQISDISARSVTLTVPILGAVTIATGQGVALINAIDTVNITGNTIERANDVLPLATFPGGQGIQIANFSGQVNLNIANNQIRANQNDGILMGFAGTAGGTTPPATANITITNNTIENNGGAAPVRGDGIGIGLEQAASVNLLIENNTIRNNGDEGIDIRLGLQAVPLLNPTSAQLTATIRNNPAISNNGQNGVQVSVRGGSTARVAIDNNTIANNGQRAVDLSTASLIGLGSPNLSTNVRGNTITQGSTPPVVQAVTTGSLGAAQTQCLDLRGNTFTVPSPTVQLNNPANLPANTFSVVGGVFNIATANTFSGVFTTNFPPGFAAYTTVAACP
jgi:hypothetical protein